MRSTARKFHFLKVVFIVVDRTILHKALFPDKPDEGLLISGATGQNPRAVLSIGGGPQAE
jgi:hypothetical protein